MESARSDTDEARDIDLALRDAFTAALPRLANVAVYHFRHVRCRHVRDDCVGETVALCWAWFVRLVRRGRNPTSFLSVLARYAALAVRSGRRVGGYEKTTEVLSPWAQSRRGFAVTPLRAAADPVAEALADNTVTPVPDQVQFRCDFPAWRRTLPAPKGRLVDLLAVGHRTADAAVACGVSEARVSQLRREFRASYEAYCRGRAAH